MNGCDMMIPMNGFTGIDKSKISDIRIGQWNGGIYYIDQVFFAKTLPELSPIPPEKPTAYYPAGEYDHLLCGVTVTNERCPNIIIQRMERFQIRHSIQYKIQ